MKKIPLTRGFFAIIDDDDYERISKWKWYSFFTHGQVRARRNETIGKKKQRTMLMHRFVIGAKKGEYVDHINGNPLDNRKKNLRICTNAENTRNSKTPKNNSSGFKGVCWDLDRKKWVAQIGHNFKRKHIGLFASKIKAAEAYDAMAKTLFGKFARLNFPKK